MRDILKAGSAVAFLALAACHPPSAPDGGSGHPKAKAPEPAGASSPAPAPVDPIAAALTRLEGDAPVNDRGPSPIPGLISVRAGQNFYYVSPDGRYAVRGELLDTQADPAHNNLTQHAQQALRQTAIEGFQPTQAIVQSPDKGVVRRGRLRILFDLDCSYCQTMQAQARTYTQVGLTLEYYPFARAGIDSPSAQKMAQIWCAPPGRRLAALQRALEAGPQPSAPDHNCSTGRALVAHYTQLGHVLGVSGTPGVFTEQGHLIGGYVDAPTALQRLADEARMTP